MSSFFAVASAQTTWVTTPLDDTFVTPGPNQNLRQNNYGGAITLAVAGPQATREGQGARGRLDALLRFDLAGAKAAFDAAYGVDAWIVSSVVLALTTTEPANAIFNDNRGGRFTATWLASDAWVAGTGVINDPSSVGLTFATLPNFRGGGDQLLGTYAFSTLNVGGTASYELFPTTGLRGDVAAGSAFSVFLRAEDETMSYAFQSGDFANPERRPTLAIVAAPIPEPSVVALVILGALGFAGRRRRRGAAAL